MLLGDYMEKIKRLTTSLLFGKNIHIKNVSKKNFSDPGMHWHSYCELIYCEKGVLESTINGTKIEAHPNSLYLLTLVDFHHTVIKYPDKDFNFTNISFAENAVDKQLISELNCAYYIESCDEKIKSLVDIIQKTENETEMHYILNALLLNVIKKENKLEPTENPMLNHNILQCIRYISNNFQNPITLKSTAEYLHLSPEYLSGLFSKACGCTFKEYLISYRITYAKELLKSTKNSVTDICFLCGYSNLTNFLKSFKKHTNQSPSEYRSNHA